jgi:hypothetical protein
MVQKTRRRDRHHRKQNKTMKIVGGFLSRGATIYVRGLSPDAIANIANENEVDAFIEFLIRIHYEGKIPDNVDLADIAQKIKSTTVPMLSYIFGFGRFVENNIREKIINKLKNLQNNTDGNVLIEKITPIVSPNVTPELTETDQPPESPTVRPPDRPFRETLLPETPQDTALEPTPEIPSQPLPTNPSSLNQERCGICQEQMIMGSPDRGGVVTLHADHRFHKDCICESIRRGFLKCPYDNEYDITDEDKMRLCGSNMVSPPPSSNEVQPPPTEDAAQEYMHYLVLFVPSANAPESPIQIVLKSQADDSGNYAMVYEEGRNNGGTFFPVQNATPVTTV